ncbi:hypothetical protein LINGRAHAP2_LOCUS17498 [Linum grandiflorum]
MPEAIRTSVLSRRWTHLWKSAVSVLDFDGLEELEPLYRMQRPVKTLAKKRIWFMNWVNRVVSQMQQTSTCSRLTKFRIYFNLTRKSNSEGDIDRWLEFAISKRLESLHLELNVEIRDCVKNYVFPKECWHHIKTPAGLHDIRSLRSLRLSYVDVGGEILEHFIANCPVLEELAVKSSSRLKNLKVVGSSHSPLPLKHLEVRFCRFLASLEVDHTPRLERLIYVGHATPMEIRVGNCPSLVDMTLGYSFITNEAFTSLSSYATRLVSLVWKVNHHCFPIPDVAELSNLERLKVESRTGGVDSILGLIPLLKVCPRLHTLQLFLVQFQTADTELLLRRIVDVIKLRLDNVKVVEVVGFGGYKVEYEFLEYVMEYFVGLERIVIDLSTACQCSDDASLGGLKYKMLLRSDDQLRKAEELVSDLKSRAASTVEFLVI